MSVTFTAWNNNTNKPVGPMTREVFECGCGGHSDCRECQGSDKIVFESPEAAMNLANGNARVFMEGVLGWKEFDYGGSMTLAQARQALMVAENTRANIHHLERPEGVEGGEACVVEENGVKRIGRTIKIIQCGLPQEQLESYIDRWKSIVTIAIEHGATHISWG